MLQHNRHSGHVGNVPLDMPYAFMIEETSSKLFQFRAQTLVTKSLAVTSPQPKAILLRALSDSVVNPPSRFGRNGEARIHHGVTEGTEKDPLRPHNRP